MFTQLTKLFKTKVVNKEMADKYRQVFTGKVGEEVLEDILRHCHLDQSSFVPNDPNYTAFKEGKRRVGLQILSYLKKTKTLDTRYYIVYNI